MSFFFKHILPFSLHTAVCLGNGLDAITAFANAACTGFLGLALLWRATLLAAYALGGGVPRADEVLVYVEGFCAVG